MSLYKAQATQYQRAIQLVGDCEPFPPDRVKAKTLDEAQGDEADFAFVDYTAGSHPGVTTEPFRGTLATTRARGFTILPLNRGLFVGWETRDAKRKRADVPTKSSALTTASRPTNLWFECDAVCMVRHMSMIPSPAQMRSQHQENAFARLMPTRHVILLKLAPRAFAETVLRRDIVRTSALLDIPAE